MEVRALIVDDEPLAQNVIQQYANKIPALKIVGCCNDAICAHQKLTEESVDLLFLDINMPKLSGISFLRNLRNPPMVIFTTAYSEYALEGFELDALDYLKKPFSFERFCKAYYKAEEMLQLRQTSEKQVSVESRFLFVKSNKKTIKIDFNEILFIEGLGDYIKIHLPGNKIVTNLAMKKIISLLPEHKFYRIHKSFIIAIDKIELIEGNMVKIHESKLPVGNSYRQDFFQFVNSYLAD